MKDVSARVRSAGVLSAVRSAGVLRAVLSAGVLRAVLSAGVLGAVLSAGGLSAKTLIAQELPAGPGRDVVAKRCLACHEADVMTQQRLTRAAWGRTVDKMVRWGATLEAGERDPMLDHLAAYFAAQPVSRHIVATAGSEAVYKGACLSCHEDDLIKAQRLTRASWARTVDKMIRWGANVPVAERDALIDYLAARYPPR